MANGFTVVTVLIYPDGGHKTSVDTAGPSTPVSAFAAPNGGHKTLDVPSASGGTATIQITTSKASSTVNVT
jgi:hypothetical protein